MTICTSKKTVTFRGPFFVGGSDEVLPVRTCSVDADEGLLEAISFYVYWKVDAPKRDQVPAKIPVARDASQKTLKRIKESPREETGRQAIERGEDEGMIVHKSTTSSMPTNKGEHPNAIAAR